MHVKFYQTGHSVWMAKAIVKKCIMRVILCVSFQWIEKRSLKWNSSLKNVNTLLRPVLASPPLSRRYWKYNIQVQTKFIGNIISTDMKKSNWFRCYSTEILTTCRRRNSTSKDFNVILKNITRTQIRKTIFGYDLNLQKH